MNALALGFDIGGTRTRAALVQRDGAIVARRAAPTPEGGEPQALGGLLSELARELEGEAPATIAQFTGIALPGVWDERERVMRRAFNLPRLEGVNFGALFEAAVGRCCFETDVIAAAIAQHRVLAQPPGRFVYLSIGTGVGGAVLFDGAPLRHTLGGAGRLGHLIVDSAADAPLGSSRIRGSLEAMLCGTPAAKVPLERRARALAIGLLQLTHLFAPDLISLGGGAIERAPSLLLAAVAEFVAIASPLTPAAMQIESASLAGDDAGVIGAALLAHARS